MCAAVFRPFCTSKGVREVQKASSERRMIVEVVVTVAGKMTGNFGVLKSDGTTFFKMASERGKSEQRKGKRRNPGGKKWFRRGRIATVA